MVCLVNSWKPLFLLIGILFGYFAFPQEVSTPLTVKEQPPPQGPNAAQPSWFQVGSDKYLSWIEADEQRGSLRFARYGTVEWSKPKTVVRHRRMLVNWADVPKLAASGELMVAVWPCRMEIAGHGYGLRFRTSLDDGVTWSEDRWLHQGRRPTEYGFISLVPLAGSRIGVLWLDGRNLKPGNHDHGYGGTMELRYLELSKQGLSAERVLDKRTCECCQTDMVAGPNGLIATFRDQSESQIRDIAYVFEKNGQWGDSRVLFPDQWMIHGCPVNGPAIAIQKQLLASAWFTGQGVAKVQVGLWDLAADKAQGRLTLPGLPLGRVDTLFIDERRLAVTWLEADGETTKVMLALLGNEPELKQLQSSQSLGTTLSGRTAGFPRIISDHGDLLVAYRVERGITVIRIDL